VREICFLTPSRGNAFMDEILRAVADSIAQQGVSVRFEVDRYPPFEDDVAYVAIPHEFFVLAPDAGAPSPGHLRRTVGFCVELPGTEWFALTCHYGAQLGGLVDIRRGGVEALRMLGLTAEHVPLGYTPLWDRWGRDESVSRPLDFLYMGSAEARRAQVLAGWARTLAGRSSRLLVASWEAKPAAGPSFVVGEEKLELLRRARTLLNVHRAGADALEWARVLEAICNGCVVVSERSVDMEPLVPGEHLLVGRAESVCLLADRLLDDPDRLAAMRLAAYDFVRSQLPLSVGAGRLLDVCERVAGRSLRRSSAAALSHPPPPPAQSDSARPAEDALRPLRAAIKRVAIDVGETRRELARLRDGDTGSARVESIAQTPAWERATPRVSVIVSLYDYEAEVRDALASVAASEFSDYEVLVLDDASNDGSVAAVCAFLEAHPWMPAALYRHSRNAGLARTRNALAQRARGELLFVLDADNGLYPHGLGRLVEALDADPGASFAYPIVAVQERGRPVGLLSAHGWDADALRVDSTIDAMALIRRQALSEAGGYCEDPRMVGHEDYDLWCQIAERGGRGAHVPEILAWYRRSAHSMLSVMGLDLSEGHSLMAARAPRVFGDSAPFPGP
jgi:hypothetical protein